MHANNLYHETHRKCKTFHPKNTKKKKMQKMHTVIAKTTQKMP